MTMNEKLDRNQKEDIRVHVERILQSVRAYLRMEAGFVSECTSSARIFQFIDCSHDIPIREDAGDPLDESFCYRAISGEIPSLLADARQHAVLRDLPATTSIPVGAHVSVPIFLTDGSIYGTFCFFSREARPDLNDAHLDVVRVCADLIGSVISAELTRGRTDGTTRRLIDDVMSVRDISTVYQSIDRAPMAC